MSTEHTTPAFPAAFTSHQPGMSMREYAAIQLRVPDSGTDWLDAMIRAARSRDVFIAAIASDDTTATAAECVVHAASKGLI